MWLKTKSGRLIEMPGPEEDAAITAAAQSDPDAVPLTDAGWEAAKPTLRRGRPPAVVTKERITIRLSPEILRYFRASGPGWETRLDEVLREWVRSPPCRPAFCDLHNATPDGSGSTAGSRYCRRPRRGYPSPGTAAPGAQGGLTGLIGACVDAVLEMGQKGKGLLETC